MKLFKGNKKGILPALVIPLGIIILLFALFSPAIIKVWQISFSKPFTGGPTVWAIVLLVIVILMLKRNRQQARIQYAEAVR